MRAIIPDELKAEYYDDWRMSPGLEANGLVFLTGMTGSRVDGPPASDPEEQIREAFGKIGRVLEVGGMGWGDLVEMTSYHIGLHDHLDLFRRIKDELVREPYPAWTAIGVASLCTPGTIVEIRAVARRPGGT